MSTATASHSTAPELRSLNRVASIPFVSDSLNTIHSSLQSHFLTRSPYNAGLAITGHAYTLSQPLQARLAPVLLRADGFANMGLDMVEHRYPYPFQTKTETIYKDLKAVPDHAVVVANKTASDIAHDLDQRLTPLVNRYESVIARFSHHSSASSDTNSETSTSESMNGMNDTAQTQVERAYRLTRDLRNQLYSLTAEQLKQLQAPGTMVQKVTEVVYEINSSIAQTLSSAKGKSTQTLTLLSQSLIQQLEKVQSTLSTLPENLHLREAQEHITQTISKIAGIAKEKDIPISEKAGKVRGVVRGEVQPLLEKTLDSVHAYVESSRKYIGKEGQKAEEKTKSSVNGNGKAHY